MADKSTPIKFLQDNRQVIYSIALMIVIPTVVIVNTLLFTQSFRATVDQSLQDKGVGIAQAINAALADKLNSPEQMQAFVDNWKVYNSDTKALDIFYREGETFKVAASMDRTRIGVVENSMAYVVAWSNDWPSAQKIVDQSAGANSTYWLVVVPLKDLRGQSQALLSMRLSAGIIETVLAIALSRSFWILIVSVLFIVLLLLTNSRLFEYSILYNKIKEVDQMKDEFISMASHELRTPITIIKGYASMVLEQSTGLTDQSKEDLSIINVSADRLSSLIEDMLNVSRIEQGRLKIDLKPMEAAGIIEETVKEIKIQADEKKLVLAYSLEPGSKTNINIDRDKFKQILINLLGNAIKYTPTGSVDIKAFNRDKNLVILIKDTGIGMTAKEREHLFEKFYRVKNKKTEEINGTGLGLWITKQIVELMNGTISVDSMENVGTQITIGLPLIEEKNK
ncbi:MAG: HAMP domain-containing sensor histidine kinase [Candidatus Paceibacterota bacterium]